MAANRVPARLLSPQWLLVAVTGYATEEDRERSAAAGIDLHPLKPVEPSFLLGLSRHFANHLNPATVE